MLRWRFKNLTLLLFFLQTHCGDFSYLHLANSSSTFTWSTWTARDSARNWQSITISADGQKMAAVVDNGNIYTSSDSGVTWTSRASVQPWRGIASSADGTKLVAVAGDSGGAVPANIFTSTDSGVTWNPGMSTGWVAVGGWNEISGDNPRISSVHFHR